MNDDFTSPNGALPPEDAALEARLERAGANWRMQSLPVATTAQRVAHIAAQGHTNRIQPSFSEKEHTSLRTQHAERTQHGPSRRGTLLATTAVAALLVSISAVLFPALHANHLRTTPQAQHTPPVSPTVPHGQWIPQPQLAYDGSFNQGVFGAIAPTDPQVVYEPVEHPTDSGKFYTLRHTEDGGAHWQNVALPVSGANIDNIGVVMHPLNPRILFLTMTDNVTTDCPADLIHHEQSDSRAAGTGNGSYCWLHYVSTDDGAHWRMIRFPAAGMVLHSLAEQANILYAVVLCPDFSCRRLVASHDDGFTWKYVDAALAQQTSQLCDFAIPGVGATFYAVARPQGCNWMSQAKYQVWRSGDAGTHWSLVSTLPTPNLDAFQTIQMMSAASPSISWLFALNPATTQTLTDKTGGTYYAYNQTPASLHVSVDGGSKWIAAPDAGIASGLKLDFDFGILGVLADGTVVMPFISQNQVEAVNGFTLYGWRPGDAAWHRIAPEIGGAIAGVAITVIPETGQVSIWTVVQSLKLPLHVSFFRCDL